MKLFAFVALCSCGFDLRTTRLPFVGQPFCDGPQQMVGRDPADGNHYEYQCPGGCFQTPDGVACGTTGVYEGMSCWPGFEGQSACSGPLEEMVCAGGNWSRQSLGTCKLEKGVRADGP